MEGNKFRYAILLLAIVMVLIMVGKANAQPYSQVNIFDNVTQSSNFYSYSMVQYTLTLYNTSSSEFNISLPSNIENLSVLNGLKFKVYPNTDCHTFSVSSSCILVQIYNIKQGIPINLRYDYYQNYSNANGTFNSTIFFLPSSFTKSLSIKMLLPRNAYIPSNAYEVPSSTITPVGDHFEVSWDLIDQSYPNISGYYIDLPFTIEYNLKFINKTPLNQNYYLYIIIAIIVFAGIASGYIYKTKYKKITLKKTKKKTNKNFVLGLLKPDEKAVLSAIDKKGFTYQADIIKKTGFSKIKVSKILTKLTNYKLLKIKQEGRVNKVKRL
ncbi:MAG: helix-turn-helix transcriptional regulator [Candidatus Parvarchaeum sp.]